MSVPPRDLRLYLDLAEEGGRTVASVFVEDKRGEEIAARRQTVPARDSRPPQSLLLQFFALLEEALIHDGTRLRIHLCPRFKGLDLGLPVLPAAEIQGARSGGREPAAAAPEPLDASTEAACDALRVRIQELASAFERLTISVLEEGHENRATPLLRGGR